MNIEFYIVKRDLYLFRQEEKEVTKENFKQWVKDILWYELTENELEILYTYLAEGEEKGNKFYKKTIEEEFSQMTDSEKSYKFLELYEKGNFDLIMLECIENKNDIIDKIVEKDDPFVLEKMIDEIGIEFVAEYINQNGANKEDIIDFLIVASTPQEIKSLLPALKNDSERAEILLKVKNSSDREKGAVLQYIENEYYRLQIVRNTCSTTKDLYSEEELLDNIRNYEGHRINIDACETEEEKVQYINSLEERELRVAFLKDIKLRENRDSVIDGLTSEIDVEIEPQVKLVQQMISEFFEDKLGDKFDDSKREKLRIAFNKTDVAFAQLDNNMNGNANYIMDHILIHNRHKKNINKTIGFLIHEYGHILSQDAFKTTRVDISKAIDEGAQDLFSELVINHYLEKHGSVILNGKQVRMEYPYISYSGYKNENMWMRSILAPLEKEGKDIEAFAEFQIGDKKKYLELAFGRREIDSFEPDAFGNPNLDTCFSQIYRAHKEFFSNVNRNSIYYRRNKLLPLLEMQSMIEETGESILGGGNYDASNVAGLIFQDKKIYSIPREDLQLFCDLFYAQDKVVVINYDNFANSKINELTNEEIDKYSFEILNGSMGLWSRLVKAGTTMERVWGRALTREIEKIDEGQDINVSIDKYKKIIPDFSDMLTRDKYDSNEYLFDRVKDLQFAYVQQIETAILDGRADEVIQGLTDEKTGKLYIDESIAEVFKNNNVSFESVSYNNTTYRAQDILDSTVRANINFDDVKTAAVVFEKGIKEQGIEEESNENRE